MDRLQKLQTEQESVVSELRDHLKTQVIDVVGELISYLKRQDVVEMFSTWDEDKLPENGGSWEVIEAGITKLIQTRLQTVIQEWEEEQQKFAEACRSVVALFFRKYSYLGKELEEIEVKVSQGQAPPREREEAVEDQVLKFCDKEMTLEEKILLGVMIPLLMPSGLLVTAVLIPATLLTPPVMGLKAIFENIQSHHRKTKYLKNRREFVHAQSLKYLQKVSTKEALQPLIQQQVMQVTSCLDYIERRIPMLIEADMHLCRQLFEEENRKDVEGTYKPQKQDCERLRSHLALVEALEIRTLDIAWCDLDWDVSEDDSLQKALSPGIYSGRITKNGDPSRPVNLIVYKELLTTSNVSECLETERALR